MTAVYSMSSVCPCCGKQGCPVGIGGAAIVAGILVLAGSVIADSKRIFKALSRLFAPVCTGTKILSHMRGCCVSGFKEKAEKSGLP